jgi:hypothetical protein
MRDRTNFNEHLSRVNTASNDLLSEVSRIAQSGFGPEWRDARQSVEAVRKVLDAVIQRLPKLTE